MSLILEKFVMQESIKLLTKKLLQARTDTEAIDLLNDISSLGELRKISTFIKCQRKDIGNNFAVLAIFISSIALVLPAIERLTSKIPIFYLILCFALAISLVLSVFKTGLPFIKKTNEHNSRVDYLLWLIEEEIKLRSKK